MTSTQLQKLSPHGLKKYLEDQIALFRSKGHSESLAFTHELTLRDDGYYHLTKRDKAIEVIDWDLEGKGVAIALHEKTKHENFFGQKRTEEERLWLLGHDICTIDVGETQDTSED